MTAQQYPGFTRREKGRGRGRGRGREGDREGGREGGREQYNLGISEGGNIHFRLSDTILLAYFSALADTIYRLKEHPIDLPCLQIPLTDTLRTLLTPTITCANKLTSKLQQSALPQLSSENKISHSAYQPHPVSQIGHNNVSQDNKTLLDT